MKKYFLLSLIIFLTGCYNIPDVIINKSSAPYKIKENGSFVSKDEIIDLANGQEVQYDNQYKNKYYFPGQFINIITINGKKFIKLKGK